MDSVKAELHTFIDDPMDPMNNYNMGVKYFLAEQYAAAFSHFMRASERSDDTRFVARSLLYASKSMGLQGGRDAKELDLIAHALSIGYKYPEVHCIKAMYHSWRKDWTQCYTTCCMALELIDTYEVDEPFLDYTGKETILNQKAMAEYNRARYNDSRATYNSILEMNISDCLRNQIQNKFKKFPEPYSKPITWDYNHSQIFQDVFVETVMNKKENGTYLEIGAGDYKFGNNTLMLEEKYGWKGVSLELNKDLVYKFNTNRTNQCICADATKVDYTEILKDLPTTIDYLQLDCDPPSVTFEILKRIPFDTHQFNVITYEHDYYNDPTKSFRQKSRDYLTSKGYILAVGDVTADREEQMNFEDWWVHPRVAPSCPRIHTQGPICGERYFKLIEPGPEVDNPSKSLIKEHFEFYPCHDQLGTDIYRNSSSTIDELLVSAYNSSNCAAVNTQGYFKSSVDKIQQVDGWYRSNGDGIYVKTPIVETRNYSSEIPVLGVLVCATTKWLKKQLGSIDYPIENYIIINNNTELLKDDIDSIVSIKHPFIKNFKVYHMPYNMGCADGWNTIIKSFMFAPYWVITNDDISFQPGFLQEMNEAAQDEEVGMVHGKPVGLTNLTHLGTFELFLIKDWVIQSHGLFDSNYYPAYYEDADYMMRLLNKPIKVINQLKHSFYHGDTTDYNKSGGNTRKENNQSYMRLTYAKYQNYEYFVKKWNTYPECECNPYKTPFNDPSLPLSYTSFDLKFVRGKHLRNSLNLHTPTPIQPPKYLPTSITIDNFYDDPDEVREYALGLEYQPEENHGAVGFRCEAGRRILPGTRELFEKYLGRKIKNWDVHRTNGCFQWCPETTRIVYHCDQTAYAAIIFLTPDAPPEAGLSLCRHKKYKIRDNSIFQKSDWYSPNRGYKEPHTDQTPWERVDKIGNVYNRLVLFNAHHVHAVSEYFGDQIHNSRLFQLFFFDI